MQEGASLLGQFHVIQGDFDSLLIDLNEGATELTCRGAGAQRYGAPYSHMKDWPKTIQVLIDYLKGCLGATSSCSPMSLKMTQWSSQTLQDVILPENRNS